ncbi:MAG TPA: hypothetical protein VNH64_02565, partial [Parvularculaceae bacterium]|nr:hypothetical protein [Parvularculaceae bacterium]
MKFIDELKRRNVFRVAGVYAVVGWVLIQVVVAIKAPLHLPDWTDTFFVVLVLTGFPVALVLAWAFELTPEGMKLTRNVAEDESIAAKTGRKLDYAILGGLALVAIMIVADRFLPKTEMPATTPSVGTENDAGAAPTETSIAVLPFVDMSASGDEGYFSDGISEEILNVLAQMPGLKVAGRTSSFSFKGKNDDLTTIGKALGVANILEGSVRKQGERVRITAQLIKASDGFHLWSQTYDRNLTDIFAVQDEISAAIADALAMKITKRAGPDLVGHIDPQVYDIYLRARQLFATRNPESMRQAVTLFDAVTVLAPEFDLGWSADARANSLYTSYNGGVDVGYYFARSENAAAKTLALNPENAEAHSVVAINAGSKGFDLEKAVDETRLAIEYAPNDAEIANFAGDAYRYAADFKNALIWERRALELNPLQPINHLDLGYLYYSMGQCKESIAEHKAALKGDPNQGLAYG